MALGLGMPVCQLLDSMTQQELNSWARYYQEQPFGSWRDNYHAAMLTSVLWNVNAGKGNSKTPDDFMFKTKRQKTNTETINTLAKLQSLARAK